MRSLGPIRALFGFGGKAPVEVVFVEDALGDGVGPDAFSHEGSALHVGREGDRGDDTRPDVSHEERSGLRPEPLPNRELSNVITTRPVLPLIRGEFWCLGSMLDSVRPDGP